MRNSTAPREKTDLDKIKGTWVVVEAKKPEARGDTFSFGDGKGFILFTDRDERWRFVFTVDPRKDPKELELVLEDGPAKGKTVTVLYLLDGDRLQICFNAGGAFCRQSDGRTYQADGIQG